MLCYARIKMTNSEIAKLFRNVAAAYTIKDEGKYRFQIIAYTKATDAIEHTNTELKDLYNQNQLDKVPGIGASMKQHLEELFKTGKVKHFEALFKDIPSAVFPLLDVPSFGPKKAYKLVKAFHLTNQDSVIVDVEQLAINGKIRTLETFGQKSEADILRTLKEYKKGTTKSSRMVLPYAYDLAQKILSYVKQSKDVIDAQPLGSLRRMVSTVGDVDIAVTSHNPKAVIKHFIAYPQKERVIEEGPVTASILMYGGKHVDLLVLEPEMFGSLLQHFTGSKHHNVALREYAIKKGFSLSERGIKLIRHLPAGRQEKNQPLKKFNTEEAFYDFLGMQWIPPEMRENQGEIELAITSKLPKLVTLADIKADFHVHSNYPIEPSHDLGNNTMEEMIEKAISFGYEYMAFSEHNPSVSSHTKSQIYDLLKKRQDKIEKLRQKFAKKLHLINLMETDILTSGQLALDDKALDFLDASIVSIHSVFSMDKEKMTKRIIKGLSHPKAKVLAHPTGRLLNDRAGYQLDFERLFEFVVKENKALEINAWPTRLDLPDSLVKEAKEKGVSFVIDTDAHATDQMHNMFYGVSVARRGWLEKSDILNALPYNQFMKWLKGGDKR